MIFERDLFLPSSNLPSRLYYSQLKKLQFRITLMTKIRTFFLHGLPPTRAAAKKGAGPFFWGILDENGKDNIINGRPLVK